MNPTPFGQHPPFLDPDAEVVGSSPSRAELDADCVEVSRALERVLPRHRMLPTMALQRLHVAALKATAREAINVESVHRFLGPNSGLTHRDVAAVLDAAQKVRP